MKRFGLIGRSLSHSFSPAYFQEKFNRLGLIDHSYELFELEAIDEVIPLLEHEDILGLNVTIPYKRAVMELLDEIDSAAYDIGAVNTISFKSGEAIGHNTDVIGFHQSLEQFIGMVKPTALVFGAGGAARTVLHVLDQLDIPHLSVSRNPDSHMISYDALTASTINDHQLLINTTPVGMYPDVHKLLPLPYAGLSNKHFAFDLIYNPVSSSFLQVCAAQGAKIKNGLEMLHLQADAAWEIWNR